MGLLIARQPVFDALERVFAYDLAVLAPSPDGFHQVPKTADFMSELFLDIGVDRVAPDQRVFMTLDRELLLPDQIPPLPAQRVIFEIPASLITDPLTLQACVTLRRSGYMLAVNIGQPQSADELAVASRVAAVCDVAKIDVAGFTPEHLVAVASAIRETGCRMLAVNVRHQGERDTCKRLGFTLFEGYRFSSPENYSNQTVSIEHLLTFRILQLVRDPAASDDQIEQQLHRDVGLSYRLLRMVNSAAVGGREIHSIGHALRLIGRDALARWLTVLLATESSEKGVKAELVRLSLVRARVCEKMAAELGVRAKSGSLFLVGMLSVFDQLLGVEMSTLCASMNLGEELREALLSRANFLGTVLRLVEAYTNGTWLVADDAARQLKVDVGDLRVVYIEALEWAASVTSDSENRQAVA